jgi:hypothetical protein
MAAPLGIPRRCRAFDRLRMESLRRYHEDTRDVANAVILVLPVFLLYQVGLLLTGGMRNGVDFVTDSLWRLADESIIPYVGINFVLASVVFGVVLVSRRESRRPFRPALFWGVIAESCVYAMLMGGVILWVLSAVPGLNPSLSAGIKDASLVTRVVMSLGAGVHEEIVFRLLLFSGLVAAAESWLKWRPPAAVGAALLVSSLLFSAIHYIGPYGDPFSAFSFAYRFVAGAIFAGLYSARSFAVAVYTHALYDVLVLVF